MSNRTIPPFRADVVGSLLRPAELLQARQRFKRNEISATELRRLEDAGEIIIAGRGGEKEMVV